MDEKQDLQDTLARIKATFLLREGSLVLFLLTLLFLKGFGVIYFFSKENVAIIALAIWLATSLAFRYFVQKQKTAKAINNFYFFYDILLEMPIMTIIVYSAGGVEWLGAIFFLFPIVFTNIFFSRKRAVFICLVAGFCYSLLVLLPYFNLIPFSPYYPLKVKLYQNPSYVFPNIIFAVSTFLLIGLVANITTNLLKKRTLELSRAKKELEGERLALEEKVRNRTLELEEERANLRDKVEQRTKELQERIKEMETLQKLTVDRELKMVELKKLIESKDMEIAKFKQSLKE